MIGSRFGFDVFWYVSVRDDFGPFGYVSFCQTLSARFRVLCATLSRVEWRVMILSHGSSLTIRLGGRGNDGWFGEGCG